MHGEHDPQPADDQQQAPAAADGYPVEPCVWREVQIDASPDRVWELLETEQGRGSWIEPEPGRTIEVIEAEPPNRVLWRWTTPSEGEHQVEIITVAEDEGTRVIVIESAPTLPLTALASACRDSRAHRLDGRSALTYA